MAHGRTKIMTKNNKPTCTRASNEKRYEAAETIFLKQIKYKTQTGGKSLVDLKRACQ